MDNLNFKEAQALSVGELASPPHMPSYTVYSVTSTEVTAAQLLPASIGFPYIGLQSRENTNKRPHYVEIP